MFKHLSIFRQILLFFVVLGILTTLFFGAKYLYKNDIKKDVVQDINTQTQINEGEAIEKAQQINADIDQLSDADVDAGLLTYFRPEDSSNSKQSERVPSLPSDSAFAVGHRRNKTTSFETQPTVPQQMPKRWNDTIWNNTINQEPNLNQYSFDKDDNIIVVEPIIYEQ